MEEFRGPHFCTEERHGRTASMRELYSIEPIETTDARATTDLGVSTQDFTCEVVLEIRYRRNLLIHKDPSARQTFDNFRTPLLICIGQHSLISRQNTKNLDIWTAHFVLCLAAIRPVIINYYASMRFPVFLYSLLPVAVIVSTAAVPEQNDIQHHCEDQNDQASLQTTMPSTFVDIQSTNQQFDSNGRSPSYDQERDFVLQGKDDHEKFIALCEAGFAAGCRQAIDAEKAAGSSVGKAPKSRPQTFLASVLALLSSYDGEEKDIGP